jgi:Down syndrome cell adhesion protein
LRKLPLNRRQTVFSNGSLLVENVVRDEDQGEYRCHVSDTVGRQDERTLHIRVLGNPFRLSLSLLLLLLASNNASIFHDLFHFRLDAVSPSIMPFSFAANLQEGMRASVTCTVTTGDSPLRLVWMKDGRVIEPIGSSLTSGAVVERVDEFISTLVFRPLAQSHSGLYSCVASNEAASVNYTVALSVDGKLCFNFTLLASLHPTFA